MRRFSAGWIGLLAALPLSLATGQDKPAAAQSAREMIARALKYEHGEGIPRNLGRAMELYCAAARMGDAEAAYRLGWMYANGRGVERDDGYAAALFQRAAAQGHDYAARMLPLVRSSDTRLPACIAVTAVAARGTTIDDLARAAQLLQEESAKTEALRRQLINAEQIAQAERARAEQARKELASALKVVQAERARADQAHAELAKARLQAQAGSARRETGAAPSQEAKPVAPGAGDISAAVAGWAAAWSSKDVEAYLAAYAKDFATPAGRSHRQWEKERRARIVGKSWIEVKIADLRITVDGNIARARFLQEYRSDKLTEKSSKTLTLVRTDRKWLIQREQSGG